MIKPPSAATIQAQAGPFLLGALAFTGVFARGWVNLAYGLLVLWGLTLLAPALWGRSSPRPERPPLPPACWMAGLAAFALTWLAAVLAGDNPVAGLKVLVTHLYLLALPFLAWPVFARRPDWPARLRFLWGLGLMTAAALTLREGGYQLICLRAKAHLGIIELGSVLGQLIPVMVAALLQALSTGRRREAAFFALALAAAGVALTQNCSRQTFLAASALSLLMLWVYRRHFLLKARRLVLVPALAAVVLLPLAAGGGPRFLGTFKPEPGSASVVLSSSDRIRVSMWKRGLEVFQAHPGLGQGPGGGFRLESPPGAEEKIVYHCHNLFINVLAETGLLGFAGFLALHLAPLSLIWPHRRSRDTDVFFWVWAALAVNLQLFLNGLTDQIFGLKPMMYIHWTVTAAALWQVGRKRGDEPNGNSNDAGKH
jgi:O-antigen ligase